MAQTGQPSGSNGYAHMPHDSAQSVGSSKEEDAAKISELEEEVMTLAEKANSASQRFADYENEIRVLEAKLRQEQRKNSATDKHATPDGAQTSSQPAERPGISRFGSFMGSRKAIPLQQNGVSQAPGSREKELEEKLVKEQTARIAAEKKVQEVNAEIEELSSTLFQQANEMVASERKDNAALRGKIEALEQQRKDAPQSERLEAENKKLQEKIQTLERREVERKRRLERLEAANKRIERVRTLLLPR